MEQPEEIKDIKEERREHQRTKILFRFAITTGTIVILTVFIGIGKLLQVSTDTFTQVRINSGRLDRIEDYNDRRIIIDSLDRKDNKETLERVKGLELRITRMEWKHGLPPPDVKNMKPFSGLLDSLRVEMINESVGIFRIGAN